MRFILTAATALLAIPAFAQSLYHTTPDWVSADAQRGTGGALVDLNRDGWLDLVVSNGNDMAQQHVAAFYNRGDGTFPALPDWQSTDFVYNGHLDVADVNGDGWPDVAVATLGEFDTTGPIARLYLNNAGVLSSTPDWTANVIGNAFGVAFGDINNDGRPDLAVATGWAYDPPHYFPNYVYLNEGGTLGAAPSWTSSDTAHSQGMLWVDVDGDGWLDLVSAASGAASRAYHNVGGTLKRTPTWMLTDVSRQDAVLLAAGDVTGDGVLDLFMADNNQLGGSGRFRQYSGQAGALFRTTASWTYSEGYCSAVALGDVNADGKLDLLTGAWWDYLRIFHNTGTGFGTTPSWNSGITSVIEKIVLGDINNDGLRTVEHVVPLAPAMGRLFYLPHQPIQELVAVFVDEVALLPTQYTFSRENGWLTIGLDATTSVRVVYTVSTKLDIAVTNWDSTGSYVYFDQLLTMGDANCDGLLSFADINPFVLLLTGHYDEQYPGCDGHRSCDFTEDGLVAYDDVGPFVAALGH